MEGYQFLEKVWQKNFENGPQTIIKNDLYVMGVDPGVNTGYCLVKCSRDPESNQWTFNILLKSELRGWYSPFVWMETLHKHYINKIDYVVMENFILRDASIKSRDIELDTVQVIAGIKSMFSAEYPFENMQSSLGTKLVVQNASKKQGCSDEFLKELFPYTPSVHIHILDAVRHVVVFCLEMNK